MTQVNGRTVGLLQSGGLSSLGVGIWLAEEGVATHHYVADLGQSTPGELSALAEALRATGARVTVVDLRERMAWVAADLLRFRARHDGGYWNTTSASRLVLVEALAPLMRADGCRVLAHGCVGGGNDERRFARYRERLAPELDIYAPWDDPKALARFPDRARMLEAVTARGLPVDRGSDAERSSDANLAGASHESATLEDLRAPATVLRPRWGRWPGESPGSPAQVRVTFSDGRLSGVDGDGDGPLEAFLAANEVAGRHGVWLRDVVERRIKGTVCRGTYESPGLELLDRAWVRALQVGLDAEGRSLFGRLSARLGAAMYEGRWLDRTAAAARAAADALLDGVSGQVTVTAWRGRVDVVRTEMTTQAVRETRFGSGGNRWSRAV